jgi:hypothetical protein
MSTQVRERVSRSEVRKIKTTMLPFGLSAGESIAALLGLVLIIWVTAYYFTSLRPQQDQLLVLENQLAEQQKNIALNPSQPNANQGKTPEDQAKETLESLETFKGSHLRPFSSGRIDLIKEINALAKKNNVALTSGIDMGGATSIVDANKPGEKTSGTQQRNKADEIFNAFPNVSFHFSVFGQYTDLRAFINQLEHEKHFLVVKSINLTNQEARAAGRRARAEGLSGIMLTIEMSAYFQP